jgi:hypothetical protein
MNIVPRVLRWLPVPLAVAAAVVGWVVLGDTLNQHADAHVHAYEAGGLSLSVDQMFWMSNDMSGQGPLASKSQAFAMDPAMMPGMQTGDDNRLRVEVTLRNVTADAQRYAYTDFRVVAPNGLSWDTSDDGGHILNNVATLDAGYQATVDLYFDIPVTQPTKDLSVQWSRAGHTVEIPVDTSGTPLPHTH